MEKLCIICKISPLIKPARKYCKPCKIELHKPKNDGRDTSYLKDTYVTYKTRPENGKIAMPKHNFDDTKNYDWEAINKLLGW